MWWFQIWFIYLVMYQIGPEYLTMKHTNLLVG